MMNTSIIIVAIFCLSLHYYLNSFWVRGLLPYSAGFLSIVHIEMLLVLINGIHIFGWLLGIIIAVLCYFGGGYILFPIVFVLHCLTKRPSDMEQMLGVKESPSPWFYGVWSYLVFGFAILTAVSFFV